MAQGIIKIEGMSCQHCVMAVKKAVGSVAGVTAADVEIGKASIVYDDSKATPADIDKAIEKAGFKVVR